MMAVMVSFSLVSGCLLKELQRVGLSEWRQARTRLRGSKRGSGGLLGRSRWLGGAGLLRSGNAGRFATAALAASLACGPTAALPEAHEAIAVFSDARAALDRLEAPRALTDPAGVTGAAVTIRSGGRVVARAASADRERGMVLGALTDAITAFRQTGLVARDATRDGRLIELAKASTLELELAGELTPLAGDAFADAALSMSPGLHGAAAKVGDRMSMIFPDQMLSTGTPAPRALAAACAGLGFTNRPLGELRREEGVRVFRFETLSLAQLDPFSAPVFLHRGGRTRPLSSVVGSNLVEFGQGLSGALVARAWPGEEAVGMLGTYRPLADRFDPLIASVEDQALSAMAMAMWGRTAGDPSAIGGARAVLGDLEARVVSGEEALSAVTAGLAALAIEELGGEGLGGLREAARARLERGDERGALSERAVVAAARARLGIDGAAEVARGVLSEAGRERLVAAAPWIVWAARELGDGAPLGAAALREGRDLIWEHQLSRSDAGAENADLVGGIVFTGTNQPLPSAQSARAAAMAAAMLDDPALTPDRERPRELARLLPTLRFLRQLSAGEAESRLYPNPERASGAVRLALWDQRQPPEATAMTLIAVTETVRATR